MKKNILVLAILAVFILSSTGGVLAVTTDLVMTESTTPLLIANANMTDSETTFEQDFEANLVRQAEEIISHSGGLRFALEQALDLKRAGNAKDVFLGNVVLSKVATVTEEQILEGKLNRKSPETVQLIELLESQAYFIRLEKPSDGKKLLMHIKSGNWSYIFKRIRTRSERYMPALLPVMYWLSQISIVFLLFYMSNKYKSLIMKTFLMILLVLISSQLMTAQIRETNYQTTWNNEVFVRSLQKNGNEIGQSIYLSRKSTRVKAKYFAGSLDGMTAHQRYEQWKRGRNVILACSGAYTTSDSYVTPLGLTIDYGRLINAKVDQVMDALVIVEAVGGVRIYDLDLGRSLHLVSANSKVDPRSDYGSQLFISWASSEKATVFQTNLLYYSNAQKFGNVSATAERRLLAVIEKDGSVAHAVFNIVKSVSLTSVASDIFALLRNNGYNVVGLMNLDTGMMNAFELFYPNGNTFPFKGDTSLSDASNLLVYYYE